MRELQWIPVCAVCLLAAGAVGLAAERPDARVFLANDDTVAQYFPQFGNGGGGFSSSVVLTNTAATSTVDAVGTIYFFDENGEPLFVGLTNDENGAAQSGRIFPQAGHQVSEVDFSIPPLGGVTIATDGLGDLVAGSAKVVSNVPVGGIIRFRIPAVGIAGFGTAPPMTRAITPVRRNPGINTAIAIRNNDDAPAAVILELRGEDGQPLGEDAVVHREIAGNGRIAEFINELFPAADTGDVVGTVVIWLYEEGEGASFSAISLELGQAPGRFTSLPVAPVTVSPAMVLRKIARGAPIHGANGINFGPDGNLYIASVGGREIVVMNPSNGEILDRLGPEAGVDVPDDLIFGPDGSLYWTDVLIGNVGRMTPDGVVTKQFVARGVNPITFSPDGRLIVGLCFLGDGLYELDPDLIEPPRPIIEATEANPYPLGFLNAFAFGPDGRLYGPLFAAGMAISVDVGQPGDPPSTDPWNDGTIQVVATGFTWPVAAKFDPWDQLHVVDQSGEVFRVDRTTGEKTVIAILEPGLDNLAFDSSGSLFISSADHGWMAQILPSGQARTISPGGMIAPGGVAVLERPDGRDAVFVADLWRLREFDGRTGRPANVYKGYLVPQIDPPSLTTPFTFSADGDHLVVSSFFEGAVQVWDPQTDQVLEHHPMPVPLNAIRFQDDIVVADLGLGGVVWLSDQAMILPMDGVNVFLPAGLATDGEKLWVADWATGVVWQIGFDGKTPLAPVPVAFGLANPEGLAVDVDGSLLVVETGARRLSRIDPTTGVVQVVVEELELGAVGPPYVNPTYFFNGVAVGPSGAIYITGDVANVLYRIWPR